MLTLNYYPKRKITFYLCQNVLLHENKFLATSSVEVFGCRFPYKGRKKLGNEKDRGNVHRKKIAKYCPFDSWRERKRKVNLNFKYLFIKI